MGYRYFVDFQHGISVFANFSYGIAVLVPPPPKCPPPYKKHFPKLLAYKISHRPDSWQGFLYMHLPSFFQIRGFLYWMVCIFIFDGMTVKTKNPYKVTTLHVFCFKWGSYSEILVFYMHALFLQSKPMYILRVLWHHWLTACQSPCLVMCTCFPVMSWTWAGPEQCPLDITG